MECVICFEQITQPITSLKLSCKHTFHFECIAKWSEKNPSCPSCRHNLSPLEVYYVKKEHPSSLEVYYARESLRPPVDTRYVYNFFEEWEDIPERFREYVYNQKHDDTYSAWIDINNAALKIQRVWKGAYTRSMYAWIFARTGFSRLT